uniref:Chemotaxis protein n=1 Tax=Geobacter metallireducens TaxID=28232 RepID=A0A831TZ62_GEOME
MDRAENVAAATVEALRAAEETADAANLLALELAIGSFEAGLACSDRLVMAAEHAVGATVRMARLVRSAGHF